MSADPQANSLSRISVKPTVLSSREALSASPSEWETYYVCSYDSETSKCIVSFKGQESKPAETFQAMTDAEIREGVKQRFSEVGDGTRKEMWQCLRSMMARDYCRYDSKTEGYVLYKWIKTKGTWEKSKKTLEAKDTSDEKLKEAIAEHVPRKGDLHSVVFDELQRLKTEDEKLKNWAASTMFAARLSG